MYTCIQHVLTFMRCFGPRYSPFSFLAPYPAKVVHSWLKYSNFRKIRYIDFYISACLANGFVERI